MTERVPGSPREGDGALGLRSMGNNVVPGPGADPDDHSRALQADAASPETARAEPRRIEHAEVQPRGRGDHDLAHLRSLT
jgi:hypothetical protein